MNDGYSNSIFEESYGFERLWETCLKAKDHIIRGGIFKYDGEEYEFNASIDSYKTNSAGAQAAMSIYEDLINVMGHDHEDLSTKIRISKLD